MTITKQTSIDPVVHILEGIDAHGFVVVDQFLPDALIHSLRQQAKNLQQSGDLLLAGVGKGAAKQVVNKLRGDAIYWLEDNDKHPAQSSYLARMDQLRASLNQHFFMGLFEFETHFAVYPPGGIYHKHLDQFKGHQERQVSAILYLNEDWKAEDGGELRLYLNGTADDTHTDIMPLGGRLVLFLSAKFPHEVLPACRERISLTGWFRTRNQDL